LKKKYNAKVIGFEDDKQRIPEIDICLKDKEVWKNENFEDVKKVLDGDRKRVLQLELEPGDLQIFKERFTLHRVTKIEGNCSRYLAIPAYVLDPWRVNTPEHSRAIYGKVLPIHIERNKARPDGLAD